LENYDGTDRRTVGAYTERSKFVTIFRSLFWLIGLNSRNVIVRCISSEVSFNIRLVRLQKLRLIIGIPDIQYLPVIVIGNLP
jgi:hypothetical protein